MAKRPEGLSPCYFSLASPDIPESHIFKWTWPGQTSATIRIYSSNGTTLLRTHTVSGSTNEVSLGSVGYSFQLGQTYYWTVQAQNSEVSVKAKFLYDSCPVAPSITWNHIPKAGDTIVSGTYFAELKSNLNKILGDYEGVPSHLTRSVNNLFTGELVPSRSDFVTLESVIDYLSIQLEGISSINVDEPVEDSLGVSDIERLRKHIDRLISIKPEPVQELSIDVPEPSMYSVSNLKATNDGRLDATIDVSWSVGSLPNYSGKFTFDRVSPSKDVRYYRVEFQYGPSNNPFTSEIYFKESDINNGTVRTFDTNWDGLYTANTLGLAKQSLTVYAVDHRGNVSNPKTVNKTFGSNFKAPLGVKHYEVQMQKQPMTASTYNAYGSWSAVYTGSNKSTSRQITGAEGMIFFCVRAVDISGLTTSWIYSNGVLFDPLLAPGAVQGFHADNIGTNTIGLYWKPTARATEYQVYKWITPGTEIHRGVGTGSSTQRGIWATGLSDNSSYNFYIRAGNRRGWGPWVSITAKTKSARKVSKANSTGSRSWSNKYGWKTNTSKVYQGEWCNQWSTDHYIRGAGSTCWGKHKGMWLFNDDWWRNELKGRKIVKVELYIQRQKEHNGDWIATNPTFWTHNYDTFPSGQPMFANKYHPLITYAMGQGKWITLPNSYGEALRDGRARGIGIYRDNWGQKPYIIFEPGATLRITHDS
jgi:hypothetical protein